MNISLMQEKDLDEVVAIEQEIFSQPWTKQGFLDALKNKDTLYLVATENDVVLGYLGLWQSFEDADITNVAVKTEFRRRGVAGRLLEETKRLAAMRGITALTLEVRVSNEAAICLYKKYGFHSLGVRPGFYEKPKEDAMIMLAAIPIVNGGVSSV
ncbi:MAG: ribosomal protein S18-alanine N-acetyltransferase [Lachnospiraceae bacterium]|nr:ribosomal protein S18-alanine N-acetyltransferase [Lachnospiraceae bacterium]